METAHKAALVKGEVGIREKVQVPTLADFAAKDFLPFIDARFVEKRNTLGFYLSTETERRISWHLRLWVRQSSIDHERQNHGLRRKPTTKGTAGGLDESRASSSAAHASPSCGMGQARESSPLGRAALWGTASRSRSHINEECEYFRAAQMIGEEIEDAYRRALEGIRAGRSRLNRMTRSSYAI
jgi:hypothetical protein